MNLEEEILEIGGRLTGVQAEPLTLPAPFVEIAARFADEAGTVVLLSGGDLDCARYDLLACTPWLTVNGRHRNVALNLKGRDLAVDADPFDTLRSLLTVFHLDLPDAAPVAGGLFGYLAYDLKDRLEDLPRTSVDDLELPDILLWAPTYLLVHDKLADQACLYLPVFAGQTTADRQRRLDAFRARLKAPFAPRTGFAGDAGGFQANFSRPEYLATLRRINAYIASGHVYQVNMSQRFDMGFSGSAWDLFCALFEKNPAPFFAYVNAGDHQIVSTSPERFVKRDRDRVETRPIKGTRPRGRTPEADAALRDDLLRSPKDDAELSMIVDLLRNDIGKVCRGGTVRVAAHKRLEAYQNVHHLVSIVEGTLDAEADSVDLLKATFPGGSITGCPKIRAMEIIDELEPCRRHVYTGAIGYLSFHDTLDLSIAIRTATVAHGRLYFSVGGGIVYDSDPDAEYDETLHKGRTLLDTAAGPSVETARAGSSWAWHNGKLKPLDQVQVPLGDLGLQYGFGFFETIRCDAGRPHRLDAHLRRFADTWRDLLAAPPPDLSWDRIIAAVIDRNRLQAVPAAVKIVATAGDPQGPPGARTLVVTARPYHHRLADKTAAGLHLRTYPEARQTPLAAHKTLNYLYYLLAGRWARARGADEALILNPDGSVSETNTANLLWLREHTTVCPLSPHALPGTMQQAVCDLLKSWGYEIERRRVFRHELAGGGQVLVTNALLGAVPALTLDDERLDAPTDLWREINRALFGIDVV